LSMRAVQHENVDVRIHALTSLRDMMHSKQEWLLRQVCASEAVEPVISSLVSVLLKGCQDSSPEARLLCGECLGELGAVDPGRLDLSHAHTHGDRNTFVASSKSGDYQRVVAFLKGIPQDVLAKASLQSKAYTRALMHFEAYILENKENIQDHLSFLQVRLTQ
ncbi:hypothetical protein GOODEAATRI_031012, partial [Goodea atripinnis]